MLFNPVVSLVAVIIALIGPAASRTSGQSLHQLLKDAHEQSVKGDHLAAVKVLDQAIERRPTRADLYFKRGSTRLLAGDAQGAVEDFTATIDRGGAVSRVYFRRALAFEKLGKPDESVTDYGKAIQLNPDFIDAYERRSELYKTAGKEKQSYDDLFAALKPENLHRRLETEFLKNLAPATRCPDHSR